MKNIKNLSFQPWLTPLALLAVCIGAYGLLANRLGFYQDDWYTIYYARAYGSQVFIRFFDYERPLLAGMYMTFTALLGDHYLTWQIFGVLTRWLSAVAVWWALSLVWPNRPQQVTWTAILFSIYPGFLQQYVSVVYSQALFILSVQITSFALSFISIRKPRWAWWLIPLAALMTAFCLVSTEYFFALELLRPIFIWFILSEIVKEHRKRLLATLRHAGPYLVLMAGFLFWRLFIFKFPTYQPELALDLQKSPLSTVLKLGLTILQDALELGFMVWHQTLQPLTQLDERLGTAGWVSLGLGAAVALGVLYFLLRFQHRSRDAEEPHTGIDPWDRQAIAVGLFSLLTMGLPFWFVGLQISLEIPWDRFSLAFMLGAGLLWVGLAGWLFRTRTQKIVLISLAVGLAVSAQFRLANQYRLAHDNNMRLFRQLTWRAPGLQPGTLVLVNAPDTFLSGDNSFTAILNWLYDPQPEYLKLQYALYYLPNRLGKNIKALEPDLPVEWNFRSAHFEGNTSQMIVIENDPPACIHLVDPELVLNANLVPELRQAASLSNLSQVGFEQSIYTRASLRQLIGSDTAPNWCYYYQKADLARQMKDWSTLVELAQQSQNLWKQVKNPIEFLPFLEGYAQTREWHAVNEIVQHITTNFSNVDKLICPTIARLEAEIPTSPESQTTWQAFRTTLTCPER